MAVNPNSLKNLEKREKFAPGDSRIKRGRTPGTKSRKALFEEWLNTETECVDIEGYEARLPIADQVALAMIREAITGSVSAAHFVFDSAYGKIGSEIEPAQPEENEAVDWSKYTDEEIQLLATLMEKGKPSMENPS